MPLFSPEHRAAVRSRILDAAKTDPRITAAALTGSAARGEEDRWSDIDLAFGVANAQLGTVLDDWTAMMQTEFGAAHLLDVSSGSSIYRVFLLPGSLQVDLAFTPSHDFRALGPSFRLLFGTGGSPLEVPLPPVRQLTGMGTLYLIHAHVSIQRQKEWQAEYFIRGLRDYTFALACRRLGKEASYARGYDSLPDRFLDHFRALLPKSIANPELKRVLAGVSDAFFGEVRSADPELMGLIEALSVPERARA